MLIEAKISGNVYVSLQIRGALGCCGVRSLQDFRVYEKTSSGYCVTAAYDLNVKRSEVTSAYDQIMYQVIGTSPGKMYMAIDVPHEDYHLYSQGTGESCRTKDISLSDFCDYHGFSTDKSFCKYREGQYAKVLELRTFVGVRPSKTKEGFCDFITLDKPGRLSQGVFKVYDYV